MRHTVLVVTSPPGEALLSPADIRGLWDRLPGPQRADQRWLCPREAWEGDLLTLDMDSAKRALATARDWLAGRLIDINLVPGGPGRRKLLLVADMESTIIEQEMLDELAARIGQRAKVSAITERAMRGELDFEAALAERVGLLAGMAAAALDEAYRDRVTLMPGAASLIGTMRRNGATAALVSGGFTAFTAPLAARLKFDAHCANTLEIADGRLTGRVVPPILGRVAKRQTLERLMRERGLLKAQTMCVGDGANDLDMITASGLGIAYRAKPAVRDAATACPTGAVITHGDLTALLYLQGYRREEFKDC